MAFKVFFIVVTTCQSLLMLFLQGKGYAVEIHYVEEPVSDYLQAAVDTVLLIHEKVGRCLPDVKLIH